MPPLKIEIHYAAEREILDAAWFYHEQEVGLESRFLDEIQAGLNAITLNPLAWPYLLGTVRKKMLARFPFTIVYHCEVARIHILAIMHQHRKPGYWKDRIDSSFL